MNEKTTFNDEELKMALKTDIAPAEELNERIMAMAEKKNHKAPTHRFALVAAICLLVFLTSGVVVNAATGGRVIKFILGEDSKTVVVSEHEAEIKNEEINGEKYESVYIADENNKWEYSSSHAVEEDIPSYHFSTVLEKDEKSWFVNLSAVLYTQRQHTSEDMYYSIREKFLSQFNAFKSNGLNLFKDELIQKLRKAADEETEAYIKEALYDVADDIENDRNMLIMDCNINDCFRLGTSSWICEDITEYNKGDYTLIVNSIYGKPETYIVGIAYGRHTSTTIYSEEKEAELINQGEEIVDLR